MEIIDKRLKVQDNNRSHHRFASHRNRPLLAIAAVLVYCCRCVVATTTVITSHVLFYCRAVVRSPLFDRGLLFFIQMPLLA